MRYLLGLIACCLLMSCQTSSKVTKGRPFTSVKVTGQKHTNSRIEFTVVDRRPSSFALRAVRLDDCAEEVTTTVGTPVRTEIRVQETQRLLGNGVILAGVALAGIGVLGGVGIATGVEQAPNVPAGVGVSIASLGFLIPSGVAYFTMAAAESTAEKVDEDSTVQLRPSETCSRREAVGGKLLAAEGDENAVVAASDGGVFRFNMVEAFDAALSQNQAFSLIFDDAPETALQVAPEGAVVKVLATGDDFRLVEFNINEFPQAGARYTAKREEEEQRRVAKERADKATHEASQIKAYEEYERTLTVNQHRYYHALHYMFCEHTKALAELRAEMNRCSGVRCGAADAAELERLELKTRKAEFDAHHFLDESIRTCLAERWQTTCRALSRAQAHAALSCSSQ